MIVRELKTIFIHIPKCGGTSIEELLAPNVPVTELNTEYAVGWCPDRKLHLQHATPLQLLETELVSPEEWQSFYKFAIIRNPYARAASDYFWLKEHSRVKGLFMDYLNKTRGFDELYTAHESIDSRRDHFYSQHAYLSTGEHAALDDVFRLEELSKNAPTILNKLGINEKQIPHSNKGKKHFKHYSHLYTLETRKRFEEVYSDDLKLGYSFDDQRNEMTWWDRIRLK